MNAIMSLRPEAVAPGGLFFGPSNVIETLTNRFVRRRDAATQTTHASAFAGTSMPGWVIAAVVRLGELAELPVGWDGHGGKPLAGNTALFAIEVLNAVMGRSTPMPSLVPTSYGGVQIEWHRNGVDLELEVIEPSRVRVYCTGNGFDIDDEMSINFRGLGPILECLEG